ncbi:MAG: ATP-binding cassette domain-containing protein [Helicobacteraceae bacterium]|nr:ATP-binding cassette domain-containing protein [Helicobacteraceae bacterium]
MSEILNVSNIDFGYDRENLLYKNFSLTLEIGQIKAIVGKSGVGKSTLFELILKNIDPFSGTIKAENISQVFQDPYSSFHPSFTIIDQIKDVAPIDGIDKLCEQMNLEKDLLEVLPHKLSGGQLQRCSIIRAMLMKPSLLLLDEPTSALDNIIQLDVMKMLVKNLDTMGMLLITHDLDLASWCADDIIELF